MVTPYNPGAMPDADDAGDMSTWTATGVSSMEAMIQVPWKRTKNPRGETNPGQGPMEYETEHLAFDQATNWLYDQYANNNELFSRTQLSMAAAGFMGKNPNYTPGTPDIPTQNSWSEILKIAAAADKTPGEVLEEAIERAGGMDAALKKHNISGTGTVKPDIRVTHPDDIMMTAKEVSRRVLGKGWDDAQLRNFVAAYQAQETAEGAAAQSSGARYTAAPSVEAGVEAAARRQNPVAAGATDWDNAAQMIMKAFSALSGGGSE